MPAKGAYLIIAGGGAVLLWSGIRGKSWSNVIRNVVSGQNPATSPQINPIQTGSTPPGGPLSTQNPPVSPITGNYGYGSHLQGTLNQLQLAQLWNQAGGNPSAAHIASAIAMAESTGRQFAVSPAGDIGYWQINKPIWGSLATFDPIGNAKAAIQISSNGTDWTPWVTYKNGAYRQYMLCQSRADTYL